MRKIVAILIGLTPFFIAPKPAFAHSFGQLYNLPVPFWMYLYGAAGAIIISFLIIGYFFTRSNDAVALAQLNLSKFRLIQVIITPKTLNVIKIISLFLFAATIASGFLGSNDPTRNFNMTFFWIIFYLGLTYITFFIGNIYSVLNPWKMLIEWVELGWGLPLKAKFKYPQKLGYFPALIFYFIFIWLELFGSVTPLSLSTYLFLYTILNFGAVYLFGKDEWFKYGEFFSVYFRLIAKMSPLSYKDGKLYLHPPLVALTEGKNTSLTLLLFVLFMLSSTAFDGFRATRAWDLIYWQNIDNITRPILGNASVLTAQTFGLMLAWVIFLYAYLILLLIAKVLTGYKGSLLQIICNFAFSLLPIAFVYNFAHYYTLLLTDGQNIIKFISDPLGLGWNIFNTAKFTPNLTLLNANTTWHIQVAVILLGHVAGVYIAHLAALRVFPTHKKALLSQIPMLILMVTYTIAGLWILSQPINLGA